jgi:hypothetical protein
VLPQHTLPRGRARAVLEGEDGMRGYSSLGMQMLLRLLRVCF